MCITYASHSIHTHTNPHKLHESTRNISIITEHLIFFLHKCEKYIKNRPYSFFWVFNWNVPTEITQNLLRMVVLSWKNGLWDHNKCMWVICYLNSEWAHEFRPNEVKVHAFMHFGSKTENRMNDRKHEDNSWNEISGFIDLMKKMVLIFYTKCHYYKFKIKRNLQKDTTIFDVMCVWKNVFTFMLQWAMDLFTKFYAIGTNVCIDGNRCIVLWSINEQCLC